MTEPEEQLGERVWFWSGWCNFLNVRQVPDA